MYLASSLSLQPSKYLSLYLWLHHTYIYTYFYAYAHLYIYSHKLKADVFRYGITRARS